MYCRTQTILSGCSKHRTGSEKQDGGLEGIRYTGALISDYLMELLSDTKEIYQGTSVGMQNAHIYIYIYIVQCTKYTH